MQIVILKGRTGWAYCPAESVDILKPHLMPGAFVSSQEALKAAQNDTTIPQGAKYIVKE